MRQDINLLGPALRVAQRPPTAAQSLMISGVAVLLCLAGWLWLARLTDVGDARIARANAAVERLVLNLEERSNSLAQRDVNPALIVRLQQLERDAVDKARVLDLLGGRTLGNTQGFSAKLAALGRRHPDGLWLERVRISDGGRQMALRGRAASADLVPRFMEALRLEAAFAGTAFHSFELSRRKGVDGPVSFTLQTTCGDAEDEAARAACLAALQEPVP